MPVILRHFLKCVQPGERHDKPGISLDQPAPKVEQVRFQFAFDNELLDELKFIHGDNKPPPGAGTVKLF